MRIHLLHDWLGFDKKSGAVRQHRAGETASVYHVAGITLIRRRLAKWICAEEGDPQWEPAEPLRYKAAQPQHNKMIQEGFNR